MFAVRRTHHFVVPMLCVAATLRAAALMSPYCHDVADTIYSNSYRPTTTIYHRRHCYCPLCRYFSVMLSNVYWANAETPLQCVRVVCSLAPLAIRFGRNSKISILTKVAKIVANDSVVLAERTSDVRRTISTELWRFCASPCQNRAGCHSFRSMYGIEMKFLINQKLRKCLNKINVPVHDAIE